MESRLPGTLCRLVLFKDLKKYVTDLLTQKNTERVNFQPKKIRRTPPSCMLRVPPWGANEDVLEVNTLYCY